MAMPSRSQVRDLIGRGHTYETAGPELGISPGLAYMIATGQPADGGDAAIPEDARGERACGGSSQQLVGPLTMEPVRNETVLAWVKQRAARELTQ